MPNFSDVNTIMADPAMVSAFAIFGIAAVTMVSIAGFVYMLGAMLMNDKLKAWGKNEFFELFCSAIIFSAIIFSVPLTDGVLKGLFLGSDDLSDELCTTNSLTFHPSSPYYNVGSCHIRLALYYLHSMFDEGSGLARMIYSRYLVTSMLADLSISIEFVFEMAGFFTYQPIRGLFTMGNYITVQLFDWLVKMMMATKFQEIFIVFIERGLFMYLLTAGAILRTSAFTRKLGGLLIAIALALFFVYPTFYAFGALIVNNIKVKIDPSVTLGNSSSVPIIHRMYLNGTVPMIGSNLELNPNLQQLTPEERKAQLESGEGFTQNSVLDVDMGGTAPTEQDIEFGWTKVWSWFTDLINKTLRDELMFIAYTPGGPVDAAARIAFFTVFISFIAIMATIAAIRSISIVLGGDVEIAGLTHLI